MGSSGLRGSKSVMIGTLVRKPYALSAPPPGLDPDQYCQKFLRSNKLPWAQPKERHVPICQKREAEIESKLAAIIRVLERELTAEAEKVGAKEKEPEPTIQLRSPSPAVDKD